jgi:adenylate cyclase class 2
MPGQQEIEVKVPISDLNALEQKLRASGFAQNTPSTFERNTLYDLPGAPLRSRGEILRLRQFGRQWKLTHKSKGADGLYKIRTERETSVSNGEEMDAILRALGFSSVFTYEKYRSEWTDGHGEVVIDRTPLGHFIEIEGTPQWIDSTAELLGIPIHAYITKTYAALFEEWRQQTGSSARNMTFAEMNITPPS